MPLILQDFTPVSLSALFGVLIADLLFSSALTATI
jgi:hypothetical protein